VAASVATEEEDKMEEMHLLLASSLQKQVNGFVCVRLCLSSGDGYERIVKVMDELQEFVSKVYKNTLKQRSIESYFKKQ
jgi:hypothetical protein